MIGSYGCGGSLISRIHILSAAHCAETCENDTGTLICTYKNINWATIGDHDKREQDGEIYVKITKPYHVHPKARQPSPPRGAFTYDYAIFVLECCVEFNDYIQPVCLPEIAFRPDLIDEFVITVGWGDTKSEGEQSPILQFVEIKVFDDKFCKSIMKREQVIFEYDPTYLMCAGDPDDWDKDSCQNDSGGIFGQRRFI